MKTVFIFGAGASQAGGAPLVAEFLDKARRLRTSQNVGDDAEAFDDVFKAIAQLRTVHEKSYLDLDNIEDLFAAVETGLLIQKFSTRTFEQIKSLRASVIKLITRTLEKSIKFPVSSDSLQPSEPYRQFLATLRSLKSKETPVDPHSFVFITFNYDLILDLCLTLSGYSYDYCLDDSNVATQIPLLKLHGSVSWGACQRCIGTIVPFDFKNINRAAISSTNEVIVPINSYLAHTKCGKCHQQLEGPPVLVPPSWNKTEYQSNITNVWRRAAVELALADNIITIGYSMPKTDAFFHYLYALGSESEVKLRHFVVVNPDLSVEARFRDILGPGIKKQFKFIQTYFGSSIGEIFQLLKS